MEDVTGQTEEIVQGQEPTEESTDIFGEDIVFDEVEEEEPEAEAEPNTEATTAEDDATATEEIPAHPVNLPAYWSNEEKENFTGLDAGAQERFLKLEKSREAFTTRKSQELSEMQRRAESLGAVGTLLEQNPEFRQYVADFGRRQEQTAQEPAEQPLPDDPIEALREQASRDAEKRVMDKLGPQFEQQKQEQGQRAMQQAISSARSNPDFQSIDVAMGDRIAEIARVDFDKAQNIRATLLNDPMAYQQAFNETKNYLQSQAPAKQPAATEKKVTTHAPRLQGRGAEPETPKSKKQRFDDARGRLLSSGGNDASAVGDMLNAEWGDID